MINLDKPIWCHYNDDALSNSLHNEVTITNVKELETELTEKENHFLDTIRLDSGATSKNLELVIKNKIRALAQDVRDALKAMQAVGCNAKELKTEFNRLIDEFETSSHFLIVGARMSFLKAQREVKERNEVLVDKVEKTKLNSAPFVPRK